MRGLLVYAAVAIVTVGAACAVDAYFFMLAMGVAHLDWSVRFPLISYNTSFLIMSSIGAMVFLPIGAWAFLKETFL